MRSKHEHCGRICVPVLATQQSIRHHVPRPSCVLIGTYCCLNHDSEVGCFHKIKHNIVQTSPVRTGCSGTENAKHCDIRDTLWSIICMWFSLMVGKPKKLCVEKRMKDAKLLCKGNYCHKEEYFMFDNLVHMCCL